MSHNNFFLAQGRISWLNKRRYGPWVLMTPRRGSGLPLLCCLVIACADANEFFNISGVFMSSPLDCEFFERQNLVCSFIITRLLLLFYLIINTICVCQRSRKAENADKQKNVNASNRCPLPHAEVAAVNSVLLSFLILDLQIQTHIWM